MAKKITFEMISAKAKQYKFEIAFMIVIIIFASLAKTLFNFFLDWRIVLVIIGVLWYLGYLTKFQKKFNNNMSKINYFKKSNNLFQSS